MRTGRAKRGRMVGSVSENLMAAMSAFRLTICAAVLATLSLAAQQPANPSVAPMLVIRGATVIDGTGAPSRADVDLLIADGRISAIGPRLTAPPGTTEIKARGAWVVPGLIDVHVHLDTPMVFQVSDEERTAILEHNPRAFLYNGVTTVLNVSSAPEWIFDLKAKQRDGRVLAPRIFATGRSITPDGGWGSRHGGALKTTEDARSRARAVARGVDGFKIIIEDGLGRSGTYTQIPDAMRTLSRRRTVPPPKAVPPRVSKGPAGEAGLPERKRGSHYRPFVTGDFVRSSPTVR